MSVARMLILAGASAAISPAWAGQLGDFSSEQYKRMAECIRVLDPSTTALFIDGKLPEPEATAYMTSVARRCPQRSIEGSLQLTSDRLRDALNVSVTDNVALQRASQ